MGTAIFVGDRLLATRRVTDHPEASHFTDARFQNLVDDTVTNAAVTYRHLVKRVARQIIEPTPKVWGYREVTPTVPRRRVRSNEIVATFVNHATVLIQTHGLNILTDPVWAFRASPFSFVGPKRFQNPGIELADLPRIDLILLSHNHYDHMDIATLRHLHEEDTPQIITHHGNAAYLARHGITGAVDLGWFDRVAITNTIAVTSVPAQHNTERWLTDSNRALWGGFVIETPRGDIYFAGDTGYGPFLKDIKAIYPNGFVFGLLPIGSYAPRWYCKPVHTDPHDAFLMKDELAIEHALAIHHGTFQLGDEPQDEPEELIAQLSQERNDTTFSTLKNGGSITI